MRLDAAIKMLEYTISTYAVSGKGWRKKTMVRRLQKYLDELKAERDEKK